MTNFDYQILKLLLQDRKAEATSLLFEKMFVLSKAKEEINIWENTIKDIEASPNLILIVLESMLQNTKLHGVKQLKDFSNLGLKESKDLYERIQEALEKKSIKEGFDEQDSLQDDATRTSIRHKVIDLLHNTSKLQAIKYAKASLNYGLKEAVHYVEEIQKSEGL